MNEIEALVCRVEKLEDECRRLRRFRRNWSLCLTLVAITAVSLGASQNQDKSKIVTQQLCIVDQNGKLRAHFGYREDTGTTLVIGDKNFNPAAALGYKDDDGPSLRLWNSDLSTAIGIETGPEGRNPAISATMVSQIAGKRNVSMALLSIKDGWSSLKLSSGDSLGSRWMAAVTDEGKPFTSFSAGGNSLLDLFVDPISGDPVIWLRNAEGKTLVEIPEPPADLRARGRVLVRNPMKSSGRIATRTVESPSSPGID